VNFSCSRLPGEFSSAEEKEDEERLYPLDVVNNNSAEYTIVATKFMLVMCIIIYFVPTHPSS
jgi:hypothetical protein